MADNSEEINDESDHEDAGTSSPGYYTRSKRRKLDAGTEECTCTHKYHMETRKRKNPIMFVPTEIIQQVFKHISYQELSQTVRLVNHRFKTIAEDMLNMEFKKIAGQLTTLERCTELSLAYTQDDMEIRCITKLLNFLEILKAEHAITKATIWRYVYNEFYRVPQCCMYAGQLIDRYKAFMWSFLHCPNQLYASAVVRDYAVPAEVAQIIQMTKSFCVHFDKVTEEPMPNCLALGGCKMLDLLDAGLFVQKTTLTEKCTKDSFIARYSYFFRNGWFVALPCPVTKGMEWPQRQRMMHMRLRRLVLAHNDMFLQQAQYEREVQLRPHPTNRIKKPGNNVYTGYGDVGNLFFYYGVMNDGAYAQKFSADEDNEEEENDEELMENALQEENVNLQPVNSEEDIFYRIPYLGFQVTVDVKCPLSFAPSAFLDRMDEERMSNLKEKPRTKGPTVIRSVFECDGATYPRLPVLYEHDFKPPMME